MLCPSFAHWSKRSSESYVYVVRYEICMEASKLSTHRYVHTTHTFYVKFIAGNTIFNFDYVFRSVIKMRPYETSGYVEHFIYNMIFMFCCVNERYVVLIISKSTSHHRFHWSDAAYLTSTTHIIMSFYVHHLIVNQFWHWPMIFMLWVNDSLLMQLSRAHR